MFEEANILNAAAYYAGEVTDFAEVGVKAVDDYTLQYIVDKADNALPALLLDLWQLSRPPMARSWKSWVRSSPLPVKRCITAARSSSASLSPR